MDATAANEPLERASDDVLRALAWGRVVVGGALLLAPRAFARQALPGSRPPADEVVTLLRMFAVRDFALGVGLLAASGSSEAMRPWGRLGALSDAVDVVALGTARAFRPSVRLGGALTAAGGALSGFRATARRPG